MLGIIFILLLLGLILVIKFIPSFIAYYVLLIVGIRLIGEMWYIIKESK